MNGFYSLSSFQLIPTASCSAVSPTVTDKQTEYRRLQGLLQGRSAQDRLAADEGTKDALSDTLGHEEGRDRETVQGSLAHPAVDRKNRSVGVFQYHKVPRGAL